MAFFLRNFWRYRQIVKYLISGASAASVTLGGLFVLTHFLGLWYLLSAIISFIAAFFVSFFLQKYWTFCDHDRDFFYGQMALYLFIALTNLALNTALMYLAVDVLGLWYMLAQFLVALLIAIGSFVIYKFVIFKKALVKEKENLKPSGKIRVLVATGIFPPDIGGPATMLEALIAALQQENLEIKTLTYGEPTSGNQPVDETIFRVSRNGRFKLKYLKYFLKMLELAEWADVIYVTDIYSVGFFARLAKKILGKKYIIRLAGDSAWETAVNRGWTQDYIVDFQKKTYADRRIEKLKARRRRILLDADRTLAVSEFIAGVARQIGVPAAKIKVIYNSIDFIGDNPADAASVEAIKEQYGHKAKIMVTACRLTPWKGVDTLIAILPQLMARVGPINFLILGDGSEMARLKEIAVDLKLEKQVHFLGRVAAPEVPNFLSAADIFVLNTNYEALSHTLLEAMKVGAPVVATAIGGNPEVIADGQEGLLVPYNDKAALGRALESVLKNNALAEKFIQQAKLKLAKFQWPPLVSQTAALIKEVADEK